MVNRPKAIGTSFESDCVWYLRANGFDGAERIALHGVEDEGDITLCPGVMAECKGGKAAEAASDAQITAWLADTERERLARGADVAILIWKRKGKGRMSAGQWHVAVSGPTYVYLATAGWLDPLSQSAIVAKLAPPVRITLADAVTVLRGAGYGTPLERNAA